MTKAEIKKIANEYGFEILRNPVTDEAHALALETALDIAELDCILDEIVDSCMVTKEYGAYEAVNGTHYYKIECPTDWFDLAGWSDD